MALTLSDLLGETVLVATEPEKPVNVGKCNKSLTDNKSDGQTRIDGGEIIDDDERLKRLDESDLRERATEDDIDAEEYSLVTKDGVVLDIINVNDLIGQNVVIGLYFTSSSQPESRYDIYIY